MSSSAGRLRSFKQRYGYGSQTEVLSSKQGYGDQDKVKRYVAKFKVMQLVDTLVDELLRSQPADPTAHLTEYLLSTSDVPNRHISRISFADASLKKELQSTWEECKSVDDFNLKLKQALPSGLQKDWKGVSAPGCTPQTRGDVTIVSTTDVVSKFDASEDAATAVEPLMKPVQLVASDYVPPRDVFQVVDDLRKWHTPGRRIWPSSSIDRVQRNCKFMAQRHSYGEPPEIAIPLHIYSINVFRDVVWSVWVETPAEAVAKTQAETLGKTTSEAPAETVSGPRYGQWSSLADPLSTDLEAHFKLHETALRSSASSASSVSTPPRILQNLTKLIKGIAKDIKSELRQMSEKSSDSQDVEDTSDDLRWDPDPKYEMCIVLDGGVFTSTARSNPGWEGLTLFEEESGKEPHCLTVRLARYELSKERLEEPTEPFADAVAWLPNPSCIMGGDRKALDFGSLPPPGILEYLASRRCVEELHFSGGIDFKSTALFKKPSDDPSGDPEPGRLSTLVDECYDRPNQQEYHEEIHNELKELLAVPGPTLSRVKSLIEANLGPNGLEGKPSPLEIAHALEINEITWNGKTLYATLSGSQFWITDGKKAPCQLFRLDHPHDEHPYYHLNATMRSLQEGVTDTYYELYDEKDKSSERFYARPESALGSGLTCLSCVARQPNLQAHLSQLLKYKWRCTLDSRTSTRTVHYDHGEERKGMHGNSVKKEKLPRDGSEKQEGVASECDYFDHTTHEDVGWYLSTTTTSPKGSQEFITQTEANGTKKGGRFVCGAWMLQQVQPMLYYVDRAMKNMSKVIASTKWECAPTHQDIKCYRGLSKVKLNKKIYDRGNVVVWSAFSSTSGDQGVAHSFAVGGNASVFIIKGRGCRLIAPWSRYGREEEWLYPLNSMFEVKELLSEEQKKILGKQDIQLFEVSEVSEAGAELIQVRQCLGRARTKEAAGIVFAACDSLEQGNGVLDLALKDPKEGFVGEEWLYTVTVDFDPRGRCPVRTSNSTQCASTSASKKALEDLTRQKTTCNHYDRQKGNWVLALVSELMGVRTKRGPDVVELQWQGKNIILIAKKPSKNWELSIEVRRDHGHQGFAVKDDGAKILHNILCKNVRLHRIDLCNNQIYSEGAELLLQGLRANSHVVQLTIVKKLVEPEDPDSESATPHSRKSSTSESPVTAPGILVGTVGPALPEGAAECRQLRGSDSRGTSLQRKYSTHSEASGPPTPRKDPEDRDADSKEADPKLHQTQFAINMRCLHHKGRIKADVLLDFGNYWPYYAALAFWDLEVLDMDFGNLFATQCEEAASFISKLAERCKKEQCEKEESTEECKKEKDEGVRCKRAVYPKMPGALVAACRVGGCKTIEMLLHMGCDPGETDEFGETPYLKFLRRKEKFENKEMENKLWVCREILPPKKPRWDCVKWQLKNFALEMVRMCEEKSNTGRGAECEPTEAFDLADELCKNLKCTFKPVDNTCGKVHQALKIHLQHLVQTAKDCPYLSKTPVGRMNTTLLSFKLFASSGEDMDKALGVVAGSGSKDQETGRRRNPLSRADHEKCQEKWKLPKTEWEQWLHYYQFKAFIASAWRNWDAEGECLQKRCPHGVYLFEHQYKEYLAKEQPEEHSDGDEVAWKKTWEECGKEYEDRKAKSDRRLVPECLMPQRSSTDRWMTNAECLKALWDSDPESADPRKPHIEPSKPKKRNKQGFYVFERDWVQEDKDECGEWADCSSTEKARSLNIDVNSELIEPSRNVFNPTLFGGKAQLEESRGALRKWAMSWAVVNCVLTHCEERDHELCRTVENVPESVLFEHMKLRKGAVFGLPEVSLWENKDRRSEVSKESPRTGHNRKPEQGVFTLRYIAKGKLRGASISSLSENKDGAYHDVMLPALETFVVEDIKITGRVLTIELFSRGSMLNNDPELARWCDSINKHLVKTSEEKFSVQMTSTNYQAKQEDVKGKPPVHPVFTNASVGGGASLYFSAASVTMPAEERCNLVDEINELLEPVNAYSFHRTHPVDRGNHNEDFMWSHSWAKPKSLEEQAALPLTYRPSYTLLSQLGRATRGSRGEDELGADIEAHIPRVVLDEDIMEKESGKTLEISADTIKEAHDRENRNMALDPLFKALGDDPPQVRDVYGDKVFKITVGELQQLVNSTLVTTSDMLPIAFYKKLVGRYTAHPDKSLFFTVFKTSSLWDIAYKWEECYKRHKKLANGEMVQIEKKLEEAEKMIKADNAKGYEEKYLHQAKKVSIELSLQLLNKGCDELAKTYQNEFLRWVESVEQDPALYEFTSSRHVSVVLGKTLMELSTEVCVSQRGYFFTSGNKEGCSNHITTKPPRAVTFLSAPGIDFSHIQPTLREAPKYFTRIARPNISSHQGWTHFESGKRSEFHHRVKVLYRCIFTSAKRQSVRNMCMLTLGLGVFLTNIEPILKEEIVQEYFTAQFELLSEEDWGFDNYFINAREFTMKARALLDAQLKTGGDYNNEKDGLRLRCNVILHNKDVRFLAGHLAEQGMSASFLNPSDSQAVMQGCMGMYWELGRCDNYVGEGDWGATSTGVLSRFSVSGKTLGLQEETKNEDVDKPHSVLGDDEHSVTRCEAEHKSR